MQDEPNGILPLIDGALIGRTAREQLPPAAAGQPETIEIEVDSGNHLGQVRIRYRLLRSRHGKSRGWFWTAVHAEQAKKSPDGPG